jgi:hypothetical protein
MDISRVYRKIYSELIQIDNFRLLLTEIGKDTQKYTTENYSPSIFCDILGYILVTQFIVHHVVSITKQSVMPILVIKKINFEEIHDNFIKLNEDHDYSPIFALNVLSFFPPNQISCLKESIQTIQSIDFLETDADVVGTIFHNLLPVKFRKRVAAYYTHPLVARILAMIAITPETESIGDFACGSGGLLVAAFRRIFEMKPEKELNSSSRSHIQFFGNDIMKLAEFTTTSNLMIQQLLLNQPNCIQISKMDALVPKFDIYMANRTFDLILMNPPFTRHERMEATFKQQLGDRFHRYRNYISGQMGLHNYFFFIADLFLKPKGRIAFILPATWLRTPSSEKTRQFLLENYHIEYLLLSGQHLNFSDSTWKRELIIVAKKEPQKGMIQFGLIDSISDDKAKIDTFLASFHQNLRTLPQDALVSQRNWMNIFNTNILLEKNSDLFSLWKTFEDFKTHLHPLKEIYAVDEIISRGIESIAGINIHDLIIIENPSDCLRKEDKWIIQSITPDAIQVRHRFSNSTVSIPPNECIPTHRTFAHNSKIYLDRATDYVITRKFPESNRFFPDSLLKSDMILEKWSNYVQKRIGNCILMRRLVITAPGSRFLAYYASPPLAGSGITWMLNLPPEEAKLLILWWNSSFMMVQFLLHRTEDLWIDLHKHTLIEIRVPDLSHLPHEHKRTLLAFFDEVAQQDFPSFIIQYTQGGLGAKRELDRLWLEVLECPKDRIESVLKATYAGLEKEFRQLIQYANKRL